jgi:hypothetical protein
MADQKVKSTKVQESRETLVATLLVFCLGAYLKVNLDIMVATYLAIAGKMALFMNGKAKEYAANTTVEVAKTQKVG